MQKSGESYGAKGVEQLVNTNRTRFELWRRCSVSLNWNFTGKDCPDAAFPGLGCSPSVELSYYHGCNLMHVKSLCHFTNNLMAEAPMRSV